MYSGLFGAASKDKASSRIALVVGVLIYYFVFSFSSANTSYNHVFSNISDDVRAMEDAPEQPSARITNQLSPAFPEINGTFSSQPLPKATQRIERDHDSSPPDVRAMMVPILALMLFMFWRVWLTVKGIVSLFKTAVTTLYGIVTNTAASQSNASPSSSRTTAAQSPWSKPEFEKTKPAASASAARAPSKPVYRSTSKTISRRGWFGSWGNKTSSSSVVSRR